MKQKKRVFIDMDGTIANTFEKSTYLEDMKNVGFFAELKPYVNFIKVLLMFIDDNPNIDFYVLSSLSGCESRVRNEKNQWLDNNFNTNVTRLFVPAGTDKSTFVGELTKNDFLFDDFSTNVIEWSNKGGTAIKVVNSINRSGVRWKGKTISHYKNTKALYTELQLIINEQ